MTQSEDFLNQSGVPLAAPGMDKVEKLAHGEIARMRRHNVEKAGLHIGVTEGAEVGELGFDNGHWL
jgi:hypothetical protein